MAGFDFIHRCQPDDQTFVRSLLRRAQPVARSLCLELRYRWKGDHYFVVVNGPLPMMQTAIAAFSRDWRPFAEGFPQPSSLRRRRRVAERLLHDYCEGAARMRKAIEETAATLRGTPRSFFFEVGAATHLAAHPQDLSSALILFQVDQISASQLGETAHTFVEALARTCLKVNGRSANSFFALVNDVALIAGLDKDDVDTLLKLNALRRNAKHRNQRIAHTMLAATLPRVIDVVQKLSGYVRQEYAARVTNSGWRRPSSTARAHP